MIEDQTTEFKLTYTDTIIKSVIAFLNTNDGKIYIGVKDNGDVIGLNDTDSVMKKLSTSLKNSIRPDCSQYFSILTKIIDGKYIVQLNVVKGSHRPYYLGSKGMKPTGVFIRVGSTSVEAQEEKIREMIKRDDNDSYELKVCYRQDLTFDYASKIFDDKDISFSDNKQKTLGIRNSDEFFTNLGLLLSDQCQHGIKCAIFEGNTKDVFKDRKEFTGSVFKQIEDVLNYLNVYNKTSSRIGNIKRIDSREYSEIALREAVINAVIHRDYGFKGDIIISLFDDRVEIMSPGGLVDGISKESILLGISETRNDKLSKIFYRLKYIEAYGTGIPRIMNDYSNIECKPQFRIFDNAFYIILPNKLYNLHEETKTIDYKDDQTKQILDFMANKSFVTKEDVAPVLGVQTHRAYIILEQLVEKGYLVSIKQGKKKIYSKNN